MRRAHDYGSVHTMASSYKIVQKPAEIERSERYKYTTMCAFGDGSCSITTGEETMVEGSDGFYQLMKNSVNGKNRSSFPKKSVQAVISRNYSDKRFGVITQRQD